MTKVLKNIIISCNEKKLKHILTFERWDFFFFNVQQMSTQLATYIECCLYDCTMYLERLNLPIHPPKNVHLYLKKIHN